jgi:hypothetical protein
MGAHSTNFFQNVIFTLSAVRFSLPLFGKVRMYHSDLHIGGPDSVQKMLNCALRVVMNVKKIDKVSIRTLHEETASLTFNQLAIESTRRLVQRTK